MDKNLFSSFILKKMALSVFVLLFLYGLSSGILSAEDLKSAELKLKVDPLIKAKSKVGLMIGLIKNGKRYIFPFGYKSLQDKALPDGDTVFEIGSITKIFTGTILTDMVLKKEISDSDPISKFISKDKLRLPETNGKEITLRDLAHHISGIPAMPDNIGDYREKADPFSGYTAEKMFESLNRCKLDFPTGSKHRYSNSGFGLLGYILTLKTDQTYEEMVSERIFKPLGMKNSSITLTDKQKLNIATGYNLALEEQSFWTATDVLNGSGFIKSTLNDMILFLEAAMGKDSALKKAFELATAEQMDAYPDSWIGYGWYTELLKNGEKVVTHNGATGGFYAFIGWNKVSKVGVIILSNHKNYRELDALGYKILKDIR